MTTLYRTTVDSTTTLHPTLSAAAELARKWRQAGEDTLIEKVTIKKMNKKELLCALYNDDHSFIEAVEPVRTVKGVKHPKKAAA